MSIPSRDGTGRGRGALHGAAASQAPKPWLPDLSPTLLRLSCLSQHKPWCHKISMPPLGDGTKESHPGKETEGQRQGRRCSGVSPVPILPTQLGASPSPMLCAGNAEPRVRGALTAGAAGPEPWPAPCPQLSLLLNHRLSPPWLSLL